MKTKNNFITIEQYKYLTEAKKKNEYTNYICDVPCKLGKTKIFTVKETNLTLEMKCTQHGGMFSGSNCFVCV